MYSWKKTTTKIISTSLVNNLQEVKLNLKVDSVGPDNINISWNIEEYSKYGVRQIRVVAKSLLNEAFVAVATIPVPIGNCSIIENIKPSTINRLYIREISMSNIMREVLILATTEGGKLTI